MRKTIYTVIGLIFIGFCSSFVHSTERLKINIFGFCNRAGLQIDEKVLQEALVQLGHSVECINYGEKRRKHKADISIFLEHLLPDKLSWAAVNWFIPNPEWYTQDIKLLDEVDLVLCRTKEVQRIFCEKGYPIYYLGFTSPDCYRPEIPKDFSQFFHLAGKSDQKGTEAILKIWMAQRNYPFLTVIKWFGDWVISLRNLKYIAKYVPESELRQLQNQCGMHLCPSETEGFGHYLMEAMSVGAVVVTTDAPPMNEFIQDQRCLVPFFRSAPQHLAINYYIDPAALKRKIEDLKTLSQEELRLIGEKNRKIYLQKKQDFHENLAHLLKATFLKKIKSDCVK